MYLQPRLNAPQRVKAKFESLRHRWNSGIPRRLSSALQVNPGFTPGGVNPRLTLDPDEADTDTTTCRIFLKRIVKAILLIVKCMLD